MKNITCIHVWFTLKGKRFVYVNPDKTPTRMEKKAEAAKAKEQADVDKAKTDATGVRDAITPEDWKVLDLGKLKDKKWDKRSEAKKRYFNAYNALQRGDEFNAHGNLKLANTAFVEAKAHFTEIKKMAEAHEKKKGELVKIRDENKAFNAIDSGWHASKKDRGEWKWKGDTIDNMRDAYDEAEEAEADANKALAEENFPEAEKNYKLRDEKYKEVKTLVEKAKEEKNEADKLHADLCALWSAFPKAWSYEKREELNDVAKWDPKDTFRSKVRAAHIKAYEALDAGEAGENYKEAATNYKLTIEQRESILKLIEASMADTLAKDVAEHTKDKTNTTKRDKAKDTIDKSTEIAQITVAWNAKKLAEQKRDSHKDLIDKLADPKFLDKDAAEKAEKVRLTAILTAADAARDAGNTSFTDATPDYDAAATSFKLAQTEYDKLGPAKAAPAAGPGQGAEKTETLLFFSDAVAHVDKIVNDHKDVVAADVLKGILDKKINKEEQKLLVENQEGSWVKNYGDYTVTLVNVGSGFAVQKVEKTAPAAPADKPKEESPAAPAAPPALPKLPNSPAKDAAKEAAPGDTSKESII